MKKLADFNTFKALKRMSFNDFNRWVIEFYHAAFEDGLRETLDWYKNNQLI